MIYRVTAVEETTSTDKWPIGHTKKFLPQRMGGAYFRGGLSMDVPWPKKKINQRARFFFTEEGWKKNRELILSEARERGQKIRVWRHKNPDPSQVVYRDRYQVAVLLPMR